VPRIPSTSSDQHIVVTPLLKLADSSAVVASTLDKALRASDSQRGVTDPT
jgi:hypothetical protein